MPQLQQQALQQQQQQQQQEMTFTSSTVTAATTTATARRREDNNYRKDVISPTATITNDATMEVRDLSNERITSTMSVLQAPVTVTVTVTVPVIEGVLIPVETAEGAVKGKKTYPFSSTTSTDTVDKCCNNNKFGTGSNVRIEQDDSSNSNSNESLLSRNSSFPRNQMTSKIKFNNNNNNNNNNTTNSIDLDIMSLLLNPSTNTSPGSACSNSSTTTNTSNVLDTNNPVHVTTIQSSLPNNNDSNDINTTNNNNAICYSELKLYQLLQQNSNENEYIIGEDALVAAITDIRTLQQKLFDSENQIVQLQKEQQQISSSHSSTTKDIERRKLHNDLMTTTAGNGSIGSKVVSVVGEKNEENGSIANTTTQTIDKEDMTTLTNDIDIIMKELEQLRVVNNELSTKNNKLTTNMKKKRELIESNVTKLKTITNTVNELQKERGILLQNISKLTCGRDELKIKLVCKNEISREQKNTVDKLERRYKSIQTIRTKELQLLDLYRQLSIHTGYFKWGKQIRVIENELSDIQQQQQSQVNEDYSDSY